MRIPLGNTIPMSARCCPIAAPVLGALTYLGFCGDLDGGGD